MPDAVKHVPGTGIDGAHDWFNRIWITPALLAAAATALIVTTALPAAPAAWAPGSGGVTLGSAPVVTYVQSGNGHVCAAAMGLYAWKPDVARNLSFVCSGAQAGTVVVTGVDRYGNLVIENVVLNGNTPVSTVNAFEYVLSLAVPAKTAAETMSAGTGTAISLPWRPVDANAELRILVDGTPAAAGALNAVHATYIPNTAPNGSHVYSLYYQAID